MTSKAVKTAMGVLADALERLSASLKFFSGEKKRTVKDALYDAAVKRFEVAFEYAWKLMKVAVEAEGREAVGPKQAITESVRFGWVADPEFWARALDARNGSVHDYFGISREAYTKIMKRFVVEAKALIKNITAGGA